MFDLMQQRKADNIVATTPRLTLFLPLWISTAALAGRKGKEGGDKEEGGSEERETSEGMKERGSVQGGCISPQMRREMIFTRFWHKEAIANTIVKQLDMAQQRSRHPPYLQTVRRTLRTQIGRPVEPVTSAM
jgi:hypothetical protein